MHRWFPAVTAVILLSSGAPATAINLGSTDAEPGSDRPEGALAEVAKNELAGGSFEQAITHFTEALEKAPGDPELTRLLADAKAKSADAYVQTGKKLLAQRKYRDAGVAFENALDLVPGHAIATKGKDAAQKWPTAESYCETAKLYLEKSDWDEAIGYYEKAFALTKDPSIAKWLAAAKLAKSKQRQQP